jgi:hypothetical protein
MRSWRLVLIATSTELFGGWPHSIKKEAQRLNQKQELLFGRQGRPWGELTLLG